MIKKYVRYHRIDVYALYYRKTNTIYYNLNFKVKMQLILLI